MIVAIDHPHDPMMEKRHPVPASAAVSAVMRGNRRRDTQPELRLRRALHAQGLRYRVDYPLMTARGRVRVDVAFPRWLVAVFVDGCFWHGCPEHGTEPRENSAYWLAKLARNRERDQRNNEGLIEAGWRIVRLWEHESVERGVEAIRSAISEQRHKRELDGLRR
jgi:DNA mismatch endonuclease (patch repair protein)